MHIPRLNRDSISRSRHLFAAVACASLSFATGAFAQVDTVAARTARQTLRDVESHYAGSPSWDDAARRLRLHDVAHELAAGEAADSTALRGAAAEIRRGSDARFREPAFLTLAAQLEARAAELRRIPAAEWPAACRAAADQFSTPTPQQVTASRRRAAAALDALTRAAPSILRPDNSWHRFLEIAKTQALLSPDAKAPTRTRLDHLEWRWTNAPAAWPTPEIVEASLAIRTFLQLQRAARVNESPDARRAAWAELAGLLDNRTSASPARLAELGRALRGRESLGQGSPLTASIRAELSTPNVVVHVPVRWLEQEVARSIDEPFQVDGSYGGARTTGQGRLTGRLSIDVVPARAAGEWILRFQGTSTSRTTASASGVRVRSHATTTLYGEKRFIIDARGLVPQPAAATATTRVAYDGVSASGGPFRRRAATDQAYGRRRDAEDDTATEARRSLIQRLDRDGADLARRFNQAFLRGIRDPLLADRQTVVDARVVTDATAMEWQYRVRALDGIAASPTHSAPSGDRVTLLIAASALQQRGAGLLDGQSFSAERLSRAVADLLGDRSAAPADPQEFLAVFAPHSCEMALDDAQLRTRLHVDKFTSGGTQYPPLAVDVSYNVTPTSDGIQLLRDGGVRVSFTSPGGGPVGRVTGRQQTLKSAVQRKLARVLASELYWRPVGASPSTVANGDSFSIVDSTADDGWLRVTLAAGARPPILRTAAQAPPR
jgi:hypothetical protein